MTLKLRTIRWWDLICEIVIVMFDNTIKSLQFEQLWLMEGSWNLKETLRYTMRAPVRIMIVF